MKYTIYLLNGPGTNLYGLDPSGVYGAESFPEIEARCRHPRCLHAQALAAERTREVVRRIAKAFARGLKSVPFH
jgi:3-dehydroquinate dehydratase